MTGSGHIITGAEDQVLAQFVSPQESDSSRHHIMAGAVGSSLALLVPLQLINLSADYPNGRADWPK